MANGQLRDKSGMHPHAFQIELTTSEGRVVKYPDHIHTKVKRQAALIMRSLRFNIDFWLIQLPIGHSNNAPNNCPRAQSAPP